MTTLARLHDVSSRGLFVMAGLALCLACGLYLYEVGARYFFNAPTTWTNEAVQYCLALLIFLALPDVSRRLAHIAIDVVPDSLPPRFAAPLGRFNNLLAFAACGLTCWIVGEEAVKQLERGVLTNAAHPIPRWMITAVLALGLGSAALHFLRHGLRRS